MGTHIGTYFKDWSCEAENGTEKDILHVTNNHIDVF